MSSKKYYAMFCDLISFRKQLQENQKKLAKIEFFNNQLEEYLKLVTPLRVDLFEKKSTSTKISVLLQMTETEASTIRSILAEAFCKLLNYNDTKASKKYIRSLEKKAIKDYKA